MWRTWDLPEEPLPTRERIIGYILELAGGEKRKNLLINCHGLAGNLMLGQGFRKNDIRMFRALAGRFETIWLLTCLVARSLGTPVRGMPDLQPRWDGNTFCASLALAAQCQVVASTEIQASEPITYPYGCIDNFEGLTLMYDKQGNHKVFSQHSSYWEDVHGIAHGADG